MILLHAFLFFILKRKKRDSEKQGSYGALIFPRFEIFLVFLALPCICQASAALVGGILNIKKFPSTVSNVSVIIMRTFMIFTFNYKAKLSWIILLNNQSLYFLTNFYC